MLNQSYLSPENAKKLVIMLTVIDALPKSELEATQDGMQVRVVFSTADSRDRFVTVAKNIDDLKKSMILQGQDTLLIHPAHLLNAYDNYVPLADPCKYLSSRLCYLHENALTRISNGVDVETCWETKDRKSGLLKLRTATLRKWDNSRLRYDGLSPDDLNVVIGRVVKFLNSNHIPYIIRRETHYVIYLYARDVSEFFSQHELDIVKQIENFAGSKYANGILRSQTLDRNFKKLLQIPGVLIGYPCSPALRMQLLEFTRKHETVHKKQNSYMVWLADDDEISKLTNNAMPNVEDFQRRGIYFLVLNIKDGEVTSQPIQLLLQFNLATMTFKLHSNVDTKIWDRVWPFTHYYIEKLISEKLAFRELEKLTDQSVQTSQSQQSIVTKFNPSLSNAKPVGLLEETLSLYRSLALQLKQAHESFIRSANSYRLQRSETEPLTDPKPGLEGSSGSVGVVNDAETPPVKKKQIVRAFSGILRNSVASSHENLGIKSDGKNGKTESGNSPRERSSKLISGSSDKNGAAPPPTPVRFEFRSGLCADSRDLILLYQLTGSVGHFDINKDTGKIILVVMVKDKNSLENLTNKLAALKIEFETLRNDEKNTEVAKVCVDPRSMDHLANSLFEERRVFNPVNSVAGASKTGYEYVDSQESLLKRNIQEGDIRENCLGFLNLFLPLESFANGVVMARNKKTGATSAVTWKILENDVIGIELAPNQFDYTKDGNAYALNLENFHHWLNRLGLPCWLGKHKNKPIMGIKIDNEHSIKKQIIGMNISDVLFFIESCKLLESLPGFVGVNLNCGEGAKREKPKAKIEKLDPNETLFTAVFSALSFTAATTNSCEFAFIPSRRPFYFYLVTSFNRNSIDGGIEGPFAGVSVDIISRNLEYSSGGGMLQKCEFTPEGVLRLVRTVVHKLFIENISNLSLKPACYSSVDSVIRFARIFHDGSNASELATGCSTVREALGDDVRARTSFLQDVYPVPKGHSDQLALAKAAMDAETTLTTVRVGSEYQVDKAAAGPVRGPIFSTPTSMNHYADVESMKSNVPSDSSSPNGFGPYK